MRGSKTALIAGLVVTATAATATILYGQQRFAGTGRVAATSDASLAQRSARQLLKNGLDYLDTYGDYDRALVFLREAQKRPAGLNDDEIKSLADGLDRAERGKSEVASIVKPERNPSKPDRVDLADAPLSDEPVRRTSAEKVEPAEPRSMDLPALPPTEAPPSDVLPPDVEEPPLPKTDEPSAPKPAAAKTAADPIFLTGSSPDDAPKAPAEAPKAPAEAPAPAPSDVLPPEPPAPVPSDVLPADAPAVPAPSPAPAPEGPAPAPELPSLPPAREPAPAPAPAEAPAPVEEPKVAVPAPTQAPTPEPRPVTEAPAPVEPPAPSDAPAEAPAPAPAPRRVAAAPARPSAPAPVEPAPAPPAEELPALPSAAAAPAPAASNVPSGLSSLSPETLRAVEEIARRQDEEARQNPRPMGGLPQVVPPAASAGGPNETGPTSRLELPRAPSPTEPRPIRVIPVPEEFVPLAQRKWEPNRKFWAASATCHMPLYFQDAVLERYGQGVEQAIGPNGRYFSYPLDDPRQSNQRNQILQPMYSAGMFITQIAALPYNLLMDPPWEAQYDLGYYRPGDKVPGDTYYLPKHGIGPPFRGNKY